MGQINLQNFLNNEDEAYGVVRAYDPGTLEPKWEYKMERHHVGRRALDGR